MVSSHEILDKFHFSTVRFLLGTKFAMVLWGGIHPFSLQFEHPEDTDCVPAAVDSVGSCGKKTCPTYMKNQLFRISFFLVFLRGVSIFITYLPRSL